MKIYRTVIQVEVLSEGQPFDLHPSDDDSFGLRGLNYAITEEYSVGEVSVVTSELLAPEDVQTYLIAMGNDGEFFTSDDPDL